MDVIEGYLRTARAADLVYSLHGKSYVAGLYCDPVSGENECLAEYCDADLLSVSEWSCDLGYRLVAQFSDAERVIVRSRSAASLSSPWRRMATYLSYRGGSLEGTRTDAAISISVAGPEHDAIIGEWLARALRDGYASQKRVAPDSRVRAIAGEILSAPDRRSYVALTHGTAVGHLTLLTDATDELTGAEFYDVIDLLVEPGQHARPAGAALVSAAAADAAVRHRPLVGNVTHPDESLDPDMGQSVLDALLAKGWHVDYVDWGWDGQ